MRLRKEGDLMSSADFNKVVAANIKKYLGLSGITQSELAEKLSVSKSAVSAWCTGQKSPRMDKIDKMCEIFGCKRSDFVASVESSRISISSQEAEILALFRQLDEIDKATAKGFLSGLLAADKYKEKVTTRKTALSS